MDSVSKITIDEVFIAPGSTAGFRIYASAYILFSIATEEYTDEFIQIHNGKNSGTTNIVINGGVQYDIVSPAATVATKANYYSFLYVTVHQSLYLSGVDVNFVNSATTKTDFTIYIYNDATSSYSIFEKITDLTVVPGTQQRISFKNAMKFVPGVEREVLLISNAVDIELSTSYSTFKNSAAEVYTNMHGNLRLTKETVFDCGWLFNEYFYDGAMFKVTPKISMTITGMDLYFASTANRVVSVYYQQGDYSTFPQQFSAWKRLGNYEVYGKHYSFGPSHLDLIHLDVSGGQPISFIVIDSLFKLMISGGSLEKEEQFFTYDSSEAIYQIGNSIVSIGAFDWTGCLFAEVNRKLPTTFFKNTYGNGNLFDVKSNIPIEITAFDVHSRTATAVSIKWKEGSYVGFETDADAWHVLEDSSSISLPLVAETPSFVKLTTSIWLRADTTYAFYVYASTSSQTLNYNNRVGSFSDEYLKITTGAYVNKAQTTTFSPRTWNGCIYYDAPQLCTMFQGIGATSFRDGVMLQIDINPKNTERKLSINGITVVSNAPVGQNIKVKLFTPSKQSSDPQSFADKATLGNQWVEFMELTASSEGPTAKTFLPIPGHLDINRGNTYPIYITSGDSYKIEVSDTEELYDNDILRITKQLVVNSRFAPLAADAHLTWNGCVHYHKPKMCTTFKGGNYHGGTMFDITPTRDTTISGFDVTIKYVEITVVSIYYRIGSYKGVENLESEWELVVSKTVLGAGPSTPLRIGSLDTSITLKAGKDANNNDLVYGFYIMTTSHLVYSNGANTFTNEHFSLTTGVGVGTPFADVFYPRTWNGCIYYFDCEDSDGDSICDAFDNCKDVPNKQQEDGNSNNIGDACDKCPIHFPSASLTTEYNEGTKWEVTSLEFDCNKITNDNFQIFVDYGEGGALEQVSLIPQADASKCKIHFSHVYGDDHSSITSEIFIKNTAEKYTCNQRVITIKNLPPTVTLAADLTPIVFEGQNLVFNPLVLFEDRGWGMSGFGLDEVFSASIDWGDNSADSECFVTITQEGNAAQPTKGKVSSSHTYADNGVYTITISIKDDDNGIGTIQGTISVANKEPVITPSFAKVDGKLQVAIKGGTLEFSIDNPLFTISDQGFDDSLYNSKEYFEYEIIWGDGTTTTRKLVPVKIPGRPGVPTKGYIVERHTYDPTFTSFTVTLKVWDDDAGATVTTFLVTNGGPQSSISNVPFTQAKAKSAYFHPFVDEFANTCTGDIHEGIDANALAAQKHTLPNIGGKFAKSIAVSNGQIIVSVDVSGISKQAYVFNKDSDGATSYSSNIIPVKNINSDSYQVSMDGDYAVLAGGLVSLGVTNNVVVATLLKKESTGWKEGIQFTVNKADIGNSNGKGTQCAIKRVSTTTYCVITVETATTNRVFVFEHNVGQAPTYTELSALTGKIFAKDDLFGSAVAISTNADKIVVGAMGLDTKKGAAFVFSRAGATWSFVKSIEAAERKNFARFGKSVAIGTTHFAIGAYKDYLSGDFYDFGTGAVYLFDISAPYAAKGTLTCAECKYYDYFGWDVAMQGNMIVVGATGADKMGLSSGAVYVYEQKAGNWELITTLYSGLAPFFRFGHAVAVDANSIVASGIGSSFSAYGSASVLVFKRSSKEQDGAPLLPASGSSYGGHYFGIGLAAFGDNAISGAWSSEKTGVVQHLHKCSKDTNNWEIKSGMKVTSRSLQESEAYGYELAMHEKTAVVCSFLADDPADDTNFDVGLCHIFELVDNTWQETQQLQSDVFYKGGYFGFAVSMSSTTIAIVQASQADSLAGAIHLFKKGADGKYARFQILKPNGSFVSNDYYGYSIDLDEDTLVVGAPDYNANLGVVEVFSKQPDESFAFLQRIENTIGKSGDLFGNSVSVSKGLLAIGAPYADIRHHNEGATFVYVKDNTNNFIFKRVLLPSKQNPYAEFGFAVTIEKLRIIVGAPGEDINGAIMAGAVYTFVQCNNVWHESSRFIASDGTAIDSLGTRVAATNDVIFASSPYDDGIAQNAGAVYVFIVKDDAFYWQGSRVQANDWLSGTRKAWHIEATVHPNANLIKPTNTYGNSISSDGEWLVVGAPQYQSRGVIFIYKMEANGKYKEIGFYPPTEESKLAAGDFYGYSVALKGDVLVVGAYGDKEKGAIAGVAYIYDFNRVTGSLSGETRVFSSNINRYDKFGYSVATNGIVALVGAIGNDIAGDVEDYNYYGRVYVFERKALGDWQEKPVEIVAITPDPYDEFGTSIAVDSNLLIVGAPYGDIGATIVSGKAFIFEMDNTFSTVKSKIQINMKDYGAFDFFGFSVAIQSSLSHSGNDNVAVIGAPGDNNDLGFNSGSAHVYRQKDATGNWELEQVLYGSLKETELGEFVALAGNTVAVSSLSFGEGALFVYNKAATWKTVGYISTPLLQNKDVGYFASSSCIVNHNNKNTIVVAAKGAQKLYILENSPTDQNFWGSVAFDCAACEKPFPYSTSDTAIIPGYVVGVEVSDGQLINGASVQIGTTQKSTALIEKLNKCVGASFCSPYLSVSSSAYPKFSNVSAWGSFVSSHAFGGIKATKIDASFSMFMTRDNSTMILNNFKLESSFVNVRNSSTLKLAMDSRNSGSLALINSVVKVTEYSTVTIDSSAINIVAYKNVTGFSKACLYMSDSSKMFATNSSIIIRGNGMLRPSGGAQVHLSNSYFKVTGDMVDAASNITIEEEVIIASAGVAGFSGTVVFSASNSYVEAEEGKVEFYENSRGIFSNKSVLVVTGGSIIGTNSSIVALTNSIINMGPLVTKKRMISAGNLHFQRSALINLTSNSTIRLVSGSAIFENSATLLATDSLLDVLGGAASFSNKLVQATNSKFLISGGDASFFGSVVAKLCSTSINIAGGSLRFTNTAKFSACNTSDIFVTKGNVNFALSSKFDINFSNLTLHGDNAKTYSVQVTNDAQVLATNKSYVAINFAKMFFKERATFTVQASSVFAMNDGALRMESQNKNLTIISSVMKLFNTSSLSIATGNLVLENNSVGNVLGKASVSIEGGNLIVNASTLQLTTSDIKKLTTIVVKQGNLLLLNNAVFTNQASSFSVSGGLVAIQTGAKLIMKEKAVALITAGSLHVKASGTLLLDASVFTVQQPTNLQLKTLVTIEGFLTTVAANFTVKHGGVHAKGGKLSITSNSNIAVSGGKIIMQDSNTTLSASVARFWQVGVLELLGNAELTLNSLSQLLVNSVDSSTDTVIAKGTSTIKAEGDSGKVEITNGNFVLLESSKLLMNSLSFFNLSGGDLKIRNSAEARHVGSTGYIGGSVALRNTGLLNLTQSSYTIEGKLEIIDLAVVKSFASTVRVATVAGNLTINSSGKNDHHCALIDGSSNWAIENKGNFLVTGTCAFYLQGSSRIVVRGGNFTVAGNGASYNSVGSVTLVEAGDILFSKASLQVASSNIIASGGKATLLGATYNGTKQSALSVTTNNGLLNITNSIALLAEASSLNVNGLLSVVGSTLKLNASSVNVYGGKAILERGTVVTLSSGSTFFVNAAKVKRSLVDEIGNDDVFACGDGCTFTATNSALNILKGSVAFLKDAKFVANNSKISVTGQVKLRKNAQMRLSSSLMSVGGILNINGTNILEISNSTVQVSGNLLVTNTTKFIAHNGTKLIVYGLLQAKGNSTLNITASQVNIGGSLQANENATMVVVNSTFAVGGDVTISYANLDETKKVVFNNSKLLVENIAGGTFGNMNLLGNVDVIMHNTTSTIAGDLTLLRGGVLKVLSESNFTILNGVLRMDAEGAIHISSNSNFNNSGEILAPKIITIPSDSSFQNAGQMQVSSNLNVNCGAEPLAGVLENVPNGQISFTNAGKDSCIGNLQNNGIMEIDGSSVTIRKGTQNEKGATYLTKDGSITFTGSRLRNDGTIGGVGTVVGTVTSNGNIAAATPSGELSHLLFAGDVTNKGEMQFFINDLKSSKGRTRIDASKLLIEKGVLCVCIDASLKPSADSKIKIISTTKGISGSFTSVQFNNCGPCKSSKSKRAIEVAEGIEGGCEPKASQGSRSLSVVFDNCGGGNGVDGTEAERAKRENEILIILTGVSVGAACVLSVLFIFVVVAVDKATKKWRHERYEKKVRKRVALERNQSIVDEERYFNDDTDDDSSASE